MLIHRMTAVFGRLRDAALELDGGLNILQAPNEAGKSTWCAFLLAMLYGVNSRERDRGDAIAEKNRCAPWSGAAMGGRLECRSGADELTLIRTTRRPSAPMGEFQAVYTGTGDAVPGLTGRNCGETLLGVSREVYERSAFIRQGGLAVAQDPGLERRIASLITSGQEDTSYTEAADALKKQLNRRRHNKTGRLPALEAELEELRRQIAGTESLAAELEELRRQTGALEARESALEAELDRCGRWEAGRKRRALREAEELSAQASAEAEALRRRIEADRTPENEAIGRLRGAIVNLNAARKNLDRARADRDAAAKALFQAEQAVGDSPFAGRPAENARREASEPPKAVRWNIWPGLLAIALGAAASLGAFRLLRDRPAMAFAAAGLLLAASFAAAALLRRRAIRAAREAALLRRFGVASQEAAASLAEEYCRLLEARDAAQAELDRRSAAADTLSGTLTAGEQAILLEVRRFAPGVFDLRAADQALRSGAQRRKALTAAESAARDARLRRDLLAQQAGPEAPGAGEGGEDAPPPERDRAAVQSELEAVRRELAGARSRADQTAGRLHALGDPAELRSAAARAEEELARLEAEYGALQLALETLEEANTALRSRFSPALGRRTAEIFGTLAGGRYTGVSLDRALRMAAEPAGDVTYRDARMLSAGTLDQLYLSLRLAVCGLVLPEETAPPLVLDDALASFDDERCAAALRFLREEGRRRQILLFTCHSREAALLAGEDGVAVRTLLYA